MRCATVKGLNINPFYVLNSLDRLASSLPSPAIPLVAAPRPSMQQNTQREDRTRRTDPALRIYCSGCRDLNSGPSVPQIDAPQTADLHKRSETASGLPF